jgi:NAD(P)-dependent dehydrogenase (short-subunit alcohol dehydrogenase family)
VINMASAAYRWGRLDLDDLDRALGRYSGSGATKLANILFTRELARRMQGTGRPHPPSTRGPSPAI